MDKRVVYKNTDGTLGILIPSPNWKGTMVELAEKDVPSGLTWKIVDADKIPTNRAFRSAWRDVIGKVSVDMPEARLIHMKRLREKRNKKLAFLDKETMRYRRNQTKLDEIEDKKEILRDLPSNIDLESIGTPDALEAFEPIELKE